MRGAYCRDASTSAAMELGVAYLWIGEFQAAFDHFNDFNRNHPHHATVTYGMAGAAKWCLGKPAEAIDEWRSGLDCEFADAGGAGVRLPMLLLVASAVNPPVFRRSEAEDLLRARSADRRATIWPGPLARYLVGAISTDELRAACVWKGGDNAETNLRRWQCDFYAGVALAIRGDRIGYLDSMRAASRLSWIDFDERQREFLSKVWREELFLARHESAMT